MMISPSARLAQRDGSEDHDLGSEDHDLIALGPFALLLRHTPAMAAPEEPSGTEARSGDTPNSVLGKVRLILDSFGPDDTALSLADLSRRSGIPKASVHRLIQEMIDWGVVERVGAEYRLGVRLYEYGSRVPLIRELRDNVRPFMSDLHKQVGETVNLGVLAGMDVLFVERANGYRQQPRPARLGGRVPMHCSSTGKVLMAFGPETLLTHVLSQPMARMTRATNTSRSRLIEQVAKVREQGFALDQEEVITGFSGIAIPLFSTASQAIGALSIVGPTYRVNFDKYLRALTETRQRMSSAGALPDGLVAALASLPARPAVTKQGDKITPV